MRRTYEVTDVAHKNVSELHALADHRFGLQTRTTIDYYTVTVICTPSNWLDRLFRRDAHDYKLRGRFDWFHEGTGARTSLNEMTLCARALHRYLIRNRDCSPGL